MIFILLNPIIKMPYIIWDSLPDCVLDNIYTKIYYPKPSDFLKEIREVYIEKTLEKTEEKNLVKIYYHYLEKWHLKYAKNLSEIENEYEMCKLLIQSYNNDNYRIELWIEEIIKLLSCFENENLVEIIEKF
jgi:hypothetical protein